MALKRPRAKPKINHHNSKPKKVCPRCKSNLAEKRGSMNNLMSYYKNLCKNPNCCVHKRRSATKQEHKVKQNATVKKMRKNPHFKGTIQPKLFEPNTLYEVEEFKKPEGKYTDDIDPQLYSKIQTTVAEYDANNTKKLDDIVGHGFTKEIINRLVIWPLKKPEIFKGLRSAPKGILLFGPPGTGKTLIGQCIAFETQSTFFNISGASLTSKYMGESEKLVRTMFVVAKARQPSVIFIDAVDTILSRRTPIENSSSRRMKNEFLVHMDGISSDPDDRILVIGATNRPQELDEAARRRFLKRFYIPLPNESVSRCFKDRKILLTKLLQEECHSLEETDVSDIVNKTEGYSIADLKNLSQEAAMGPIKALSANAIQSLRQDTIRPISLGDFQYALQLIKPSVSEGEVRAYEAWDSMYGYGGEYLKSYGSGYDKKNEKNIYQNNPYIL